METIYFLAGIFFVFSIPMIMPALVLVSLKKLNILITRFGLNSLVTSFLLTALVQFSAIIYKEHNEFIPAGLDFFVWAMLYPVIIISYLGDSFGLPRPGALFMGWIILTVILHLYTNLTTLNRWMKRKLYELIQ